MKKLMFLLSISFSVQIAFSQCVSHTYKVSKFCSDGAFDIKVENNCSSEKYIVVVATKSDGTIKKFISNYVKAGRKLENWNCGKFNSSSIKAKY